MCVALTIRWVYMIAIGYFFVRMWDFICVAKGWRPGHGGI